MNLPAKSRRTNIFFSSTALISDRSRDVLIVEIFKTANYLLTRTFNVVPNYTYISELFGVQWPTHLDAQNDSNKRRKLGA